MGLLEKIHKGGNSYPDNEVFPCLWMKQVFITERLVGSPEKVYCLLMGQDPVCKENPYRDIYLLNLRAATGIAFHNIGDENPLIKGMTIHYGLDCTGGWPEKYCKQGLLLVNMIRCIHRNDRSTDSNDYYNVWFVYTMKLSMHFSKRKIPVLVLYNLKYKANLVDYILKEQESQYHLSPTTVAIWHPSCENKNKKDKNTFHKLVFDPELPGHIIRLH